MKGRRRVFIIVNPVSGGLKSFGMKRRISDAFAASGLDFFFTQTRKREGARMLASSVDERIYDTVVVAGGDGTINEVVNGLKGKKVKLGIIPAGTVNVLAKQLGIPFDIGQAVNLIRKGRTRSIDAVKAGERLFLLMAGIGFDAYTISKVDIGLKKYIGMFAYVLSGFWAALRHPPKLQYLSMDGGRKKSKGYFVLISNAAYYGGAIQVAPDARMDDGYVDVLVFQERKTIPFFQYLGAAMIGMQRQFPGVERFRVKKIDIRSKSKVLVHTDAELAGRLPMRFKVLPRAVKVIVP